MKVTIWGTRGSFPTTSQDMSHYGGNTTCIEVRTDAGDIIILDAGMGIRALGKHLLSEHNDGECAICFTHKHWDHIHGLTSFTPLYNPKWHVKLFGPQCGNISWQHTLETLFSTSHFPLAWENIQQKNPVNEFIAGASFTIGSARIETCTTCHPGGCVAYKITADGWTFFFSGDHEWTEESSAEQKNLQTFMSDADVILADAHFQPKDYLTHKNWGHSTMEQWIEHVLQTKVTRLFFTHYHPDYTDEMLEKHMDSLWRDRPDLPLQMSLAHEGMCIHKDAGHRHLEINIPQSSCSMCNFSHKMSRYADSGLILESVLSEARRIGKADAGTIYLINEDKELAFSYAQNDTLFPGSSANKMVYLNATIPMNRASIAGYVAISAKPLNIADVYHISATVPYHFNASFDNSTGFRTTSMLTVPLIGNRSEVVGVLQLINSLHDGKTQPFTLAMQNQLEQLSVSAADFIERSRLSTQLIIRMFETSALRDPAETAAHVMRVGAMAAETYHRWAVKHDIDIDELRGTKDTIRLAAMLHDIGKVGVPDAVLKKPGKLNEEEFEIIKQHSSLGASLFKKTTSRIDSMAYDIALHHHQKWNGEGYGAPNEPSLAGTEIPLEARITAVADVYDALVSKRCYKEAMPEETAFAILQKDAGTHFDPEVVEAFIEIKDILYAIHTRFSDS